MYNWVYINLLQVFTFDYKIRNNSHIANLVNLIFQHVLNVLTEFIVNDVQHCSQAFVRTAMMTYYILVVAIAHSMCLAGR